jgi:hypothetical protein
MAKAVYRQLLASLAALDAPADAKRQFEEMIRQRAAIDGLARIDRDRVQFARHLLDVKEARPLIRDRIMARYGVGRSQAYDAIDQALQLSGQKPDASRV